MKKIIACLLAGIIAAAGAACGGGHSADAGKLKIVSTIFPQYDWVRQILGDRGENAELTLLLDSGVDLHSYQPTTDDILKISNCDLFIYVGGESDAWVQGALKTAANKKRVVVNLLDVLGDAVKEEELKEGMEHDHEHEEIDPDNVKDRPLSDWQGNWATVENALASGDLDAYITGQAEENETDFKSQKDAYARRWKSDYGALKITDKTIAFNAVSANYQYIGYKIVESDHGDSVWYGFKAEPAQKGAPAYVAFSDHGTGVEEAHTEDEKEHDKEDHEETAHFHLRYGDKSFEALTAAEDWSPTYFPADAGGKEVAEAMSGHGHSHDGELDEHVWLSLKNAEALCAHIAKKLGGLDPDNAEAYQSNARTYGDQLKTLDGKYKAAVNGAAAKTLLFADRFPFRYLIDDYGLDYFAAFSGCSAETAASFKTIVFLAGKTDELGLKCVLAIDGSDQSIAKTIVQNTKNKNQKILVLDSLQSVTSAGVSSGTTYLSVMESNLEVLKEALK